ncbi:putative helicase, partial [Tetrabaena socialis]
MKHPKHPKPDTLGGDETDEIDDLMAAALAARDTPVQLADRADKLRALLKPIYKLSYKTHAAISDPAFQSTLLSKKEFYDRRITRIPDVVDFDKAANAACSAADDDSGEFELSENQSFVRNFISPRTPYNGLLLYHDVGVGKTCSAISIAERFPELRVVIMAPYSVQSSFRAQMFDASKVTWSDGEVATSKQCTGTRFLQGYKGTGEDMDAHAQRLIAQRYAFIGFLKFANQVAKMTDAEIVEAYAKHLFIIDEAHNLRSQKESGSKPAYRALQRVLRLCHGTKILLLTATPMFNDAREIVDLVNLLLINDNRPLLKRSAIFSDEGTLLDGETFARACVGYV